MLCFIISHNGRERRFSAAYAIYRRLEERQSGAAQRDHSDYSTRTITRLCQRIEGG